MAWEYLLDLANQLVNNNWYVLVLLGVGFLSISWALRREDGTKKRERLVALKKEAIASSHWCDQWFEDVVQENMDQILANAERVHDQHIRGQMKKQQKRREREYHKLARLAARQFGDNPEEIIEMLRRSDEVPMKLVELAKKRSGRDY